MDQERRDNKEQKIAARPKTGMGQLRGVKTKASHNRISPRKQKFRSTLERWLLKPKKIISPAEVSRAQEEVEMTDPGGSQCTSAQSRDTEGHGQACQNSAEPAVIDLDEETQPFTPQDLEEDNPVSPDSEDSTGTGDKQTVTHSDRESEKQEPGRCTGSSEGSVKRHPKITDFFSGTSSPAPPLRCDSPEDATEELDGDEEITLPDVKWVGTPISELRRMPECGRPLPRLRDAPGQHTVLIRVCAFLLFYFF